MILFGQWDYREGDHVICFPSGDTWERSWIRGWKLNFSSYVVTLLPDHLQMNFCSALPFKISQKSFPPIAHCSRTWKQPKCLSIEEWLKKSQYVYIREYYSAIKRNNTICSDMDEPRDFYTEWSKSDRERQIS